MNWLEISEFEILAIANPIMDNLMQASTDIDHERHVQDFTEQLKAIVTKENLEAQCKEYQAKLGYFAEREFVAVFKKVTDAAIFWKQKYTIQRRAHCVSASHQRRGQNLGAKRICNIMRVNHAINSGSVKRREKHAPFYTAGYGER